ncbi:MAG: hypothetical protein FRX49_03358 [Trebouxia sp. A1-2]|nr:MAG: hypothetical protein FRX49_03358 [Trebouxia sp. A1-2]
MADDDGTIAGLSEEDLIDDAEVDTLIRDSVSQSVGESQFALAKINLWSSNVVEGCLKKLASLNKPFKYVAPMRGFPWVMPLTNEKAAPDPKPAIILQHSMVRVRGC